jgi:nitroreductase
MTTSSLTMPSLDSLGTNASTAQQVLETMGTARAVRYLKSDPVPSQLLDALIWAGTRASSPDNSQMWDFVVVTSANVKRQIADAVAPFLETIETFGPTNDVVRTRTRSGSVHLIEHLAEVPALIVVCGRDAYPTAVPEEKYLWGALHAASQNMVVAGRSMGLSVVLTMLHIAAPGKIRSILELPKDLRIGAMLAVGFPERDFGPVTRKPIAEVIHHDRW